MAARRSTVTTPAAAAQPTEAENRSDEAWIRAPDGESSVRVRSLTNYLAKGGRILDARLHERADGTWTLWMRLADREGEFRLNHFHQDVAKTWADVNFAIATLRNDFAYYGGIALTTDRRPPSPK